MQSDDKPVNGQPNPNSESFFDLFDQTPLPQLPDTGDGPGTKRSDRLREAWDASWKQGGYTAPPLMQPEFRPELHIHATIPAPAGPGDVHQLQQR
ncbi:hypothetical protein ACH4C6_32520 [Streptomyces sp. NPDC017943]|uniref:hypothetical protein n=1 Tax=Streptomyces sp. NPDC017943 TaxID=3365019 RepID=UPI0037AF9FE0